MSSKQRLGFSLAFIACLTALNLVPTTTESSTLGWVIYGIIIGLLISSACRAASNLAYENRYKKKAVRTKPRW